LLNLKGKVDVNQSMVINLLRVPDIVLSSGITRTNNIFCFTRIITSGLSDKICQLHSNNLWFKARFTDEWSFLFLLLSLNDACAHQRQYEVTKEANFCYTQLLYKAGLKARFSVFLSRLQWTSVF